MNTVTEKPFTETAAIPGYMQDAAGRLVPVDSIKPIDLERDKLVREIAAHAIAL
jgi:hypothetical protein